MIIEIHKGLLMASVQGGDAGPGAGDPTIGESVKYYWSLPISTLEPDESKQTLVYSTFDLVMSAITSVAQSSCQSISLCGSGGYGTQANPYYVKFSGMPASVSAGTGQLQASGSQIDISSANQADTGTNVSLLPVGTFAAQPVAGVTKWPLVINITE